MTRDGCGHTTGVQGHGDDDGWSLPWGEGWSLPWGEGWSLPWGEGWSLPWGEGWSLRVKHTL